MVADLFHYGHVEFLKKAKNKGDILVAGIHSDETVKSYKRLPIMSMDERIRSVKNCSYVDKVLSHAPLQVTKEWIEKHNIDLVVHGDDSSPESLQYMYAYPISKGMLQTVSYTRGISTTDIINRIKTRNDL